MVDEKYGVLSGFVLPVTSRQANAWILVSKAWKSWSCRKTKMWYV